MKGIAAWVPESRHPRRHVHQGRRSVTPGGTKLMPIKCYHTIELFEITRLTRWFIKSGVSPGERQNRLRQHGTFVSFSRNCRSPSHNFVKKIWNLPPCRRRIGPFIQMNT
jgi:hypothetical protein